MEEKILHVTSKWTNWNYKNTALLVLSLVIFFIFADHPFAKNIISTVGNFGYIGAFIGGILFVSIFTVAPAAVLLFFLADTLNPLLVAIFAGAGAVIGDYLIFRFLRDRVFDELKPLFLSNGGNLLVKLFKTPYFAWFLPLFGAFIIASPFPDEVGIGLLGASKLKNWQFLLLTFLLNTIGIFIVIIAAHSF
ncbi:MAG: hypothetical protein HYW45_03960 [Candidatus Daviesbacteria bacterium]|nr:MAG: hypothetical protein HYW45_03960 [Candidatus Daviesbacteria bacterium]